MGRYFFDSSALAKRYHPETGSPEVERLFAEPGRDIQISRLSFVEIQSVCAMKVRGGFLTVEEAEMQRERLLADIASGEIEVRSVTADHFSSAEQLIARHGYTHRSRTLDALQLAVAVAVEFLSEDSLINLLWPTRPLPRWRPWKVFQC